MTAIYHITHIDNLPGIIASGGILSDNEMNRQRCSPVNIAYNQLKERRIKTVVYTSAGGTLADYAPFYFTNRSPMLYAIHRNTVDEYHGGQENIVYLVASAENIAQSELKWCFTDGHAVEAMTGFCEDLRGLSLAIDWNVIRSTSWSNSKEYPDRKRKKQAEFLVHKQLPWNFVEKIGVYDINMQTRVLDIIKDTGFKPQVEIQRSWYY